MNSSNSRVAGKIRHRAVFFPVLAIVAAILFLSGCGPDSGPEADIPEFKQVLNSYAANKAFTEFMYSNKGKAVYVAIIGEWPFSSFNRSTCGPVFWDAPPEEDPDKLFVTGTQICFQPETVGHFSPSPDDNINNPKLYVYTFGKKKVSIEGFYKVAGGLEGGQSGVWTIGLTPVDR